MQKVKLQQMESSKDVEMEDTSLSKANLIHTETLPTPNMFNYA